MTSPKLRFDEISPETRARWAKLLDSSRRDLTGRMRRLIRIALDACDSIGPPKMQARLVGGTALWLLCPQAELAELLDCSDKTIRNEFDRLTVLQALQTVPHKTIPNLLAYRIDLAALESLEESLTPELDEIICEWMEEVSQIESQAAPVSVSGVAADFGRAAPEVVTVDAEQRSFLGGLTPSRSPVSGGVSGPISAGVSGPLSGHFSGGVSGQISTLMSHEGLNEFNSNSSITHDHERPKNPDPDVRRFDAISERDVLSIAGYEIDVDGQKRKASLASRRRVQLEYFNDAVKAGQAEPGEMLAFAALFRCAARLNRKPEGDRLRVNDCAKWIRTVWNNRIEKPCPRVIADDRTYARDLLAETSQSCQ